MWARGKAYRAHRGDGQERQRQEGSHGDSFSVEDVSEMQAQPRSSECVIVGEWVLPRLRRGA